jgi:hypothetical protein
MEPVLNSFFNKFKQTFEVDTAADSPVEQKKKEATAFENFVNYVLFSRDYPDVFTANLDLFDFVCVGDYAIGIDGVAIKVNDRLVRDIEDVKVIAKDNKKIHVDFAFIQSKMSSGIDIAEFNKFGLAVKNFFSEGYLPENDHIKEFRQIKDFIYSDAIIISKLDTNPSIYLYYVTTGPEPEQTDPNFVGSQKLLERELRRFYFENVSITPIYGKQLVKTCRELDNKFEVQINIIDIFPLNVAPEADIKKAYSFTCSAEEVFKLLTKDDGTLRRSLFNDNVRDYLGNNPVNSEIERTIVKNPEMFLLCNNGITIVCSDFNQVRERLVKIENPQIVNGCQTCNALFNQREHPNIKQVQLVVRVISTDNLAISNKIVRGTNKQNQVLDEAFEATLPFHQETLEPFFLAVDDPIKIYYERRSKQYNNDPLIKKTQIVNLRILTQTFVAIFLDSPYEAHIHEAKLLEKYAGEKGKRQIFCDDHSPYPYYICALTSCMFEKYFRLKKIPQYYKTYKAHLYLIFKYALGEFSPKLVKSKALDIYYGKFIQALTEPLFDTKVQATLRLFDDTQTAWLKQGGSRFAIKDTQEFTQLLVKQARNTFISKETPVTRGEDKAIYEGTILNIFRKDNVWFGFIERGSYQENVYFDSRAYKGDPAELLPRTRVRYEMGIGAKGNFALSVQLLD